MITMRTATLLTVLLVASACGRDEPAAPVVRAPAPATAAALARAKQAVGGFKRELKAALSAALAEGGPKHALRVCQKEAPRLAAAASQEGVTVGRVTLRPRNPANLAEGWKREALAALERAPDRATATFTAELPSGAFAYAEPLVIDSVCLTCHGTVASDVAVALRELYPDDRATGYALGDFRGIAWAEVAPAP